MTDTNKPMIRVTADDIAAVEESQSASAVAAQIAPAKEGRSYGNVNTTAAETEPVRTEDRPSFLLQGWFYLGAAGLVGAVAGWGICEPAFGGGEAQRWGNIWLLPLVTTMMLICFALSGSM